MNSKLYRFLDKYKYKRFIKSLKEKIEAFCDRNECVYLNSGAFQYFLTSSGVIQKTIERAISVNKTRSKDFYNQILKEARNIAIISFLIIVMISLGVAATSNDLIGKIKNIKVKKIYK